jgi:hypothetical protein
MSIPTKANSQVVPSGRARDFAGRMLVMLLVAALMSWFIIAFVVSWPLGPGYVDEGGITVLRIALATLSIGLAWALSLLGGLLVAILVQLRRLNDEVKKVRENKP